MPSVKDADAIISKRFAKLLEEKGNLAPKHRREIAERAGVTWQLVWQWGEGKRMTAGRVLLAAQHFGVPISYFYEDIGEIAEQTEKKNPDACAPGIEVSFFD